MPERTPDNTLRETIKRIGVAKVAREANVRPTTLYSFVQGDTVHLRSDTRMKVLKAIADLTGNRMGDPRLDDLVAGWDALTETERELVANLVRQFITKNQSG